jgi:glycosyltransferase involved in cell wall biosynthesis
MRSKMRVSVVMITYNHAAYVRRAVEGVLAQQLDEPFELIIGEDCSADNTREIVESRTLSASSLRRETSA